VSLRRWSKILTILHAANWKQGLIAEEIYKTLLTTKKQGNWTVYTPATLFSLCKLALTARNTFFAL
jgi:hypothetical protein